MTDSIGAIEWGKRSQLKKPGFSDNSSIAAEILFRNPVSHPHAIATPSPTKTHRDRSIKRKRDRR
ncbi:hypothetical protein [Planktothrix agardhii]|uniref:hypothetical protein n=1 Tax=Planktothrix agardhii TaxID=1160 RepID=UPI0011429A74|nr:hypothetical protein [Planktothrix agardhii]